MHAYLKAGLVIFSVLLGSALSFSQSKKELLKYADESYKNENYVAAAYFYGKIVGSYASGAQDHVLPYEFSAWNKPLKVEKADTSALESDSTQTDSTKVNSTQAPKQEAATVDADSSDSDGSDSEGSIKNNKTYQYALYRLAESYRKSYNYENAEAIYEKCQALDTDAYPLKQFWYAMSLKSNMKYGVAQHEFNAFMKDNRGNKALDTLDRNYLRWAYKEFAGCRMAVEFIKNPVKGIDIYRADSSINKGTSNFAAVYDEYGDDNSILFTSARPESRSAKKGASAFPYYCDVFSSERIDSLSWSKPKNFGNPVNTVMHEGGVFVAQDQSKMFFTRWGDVGETKICHIYLSKFFNGQWLQPQKLNENINMPGYKSMHPFLLSDGVTLFFSSDRPGGEGNMDLWYCTINEYGNAGSPRNMGNLINTPGDDSSPFYDEEARSLYFSSNGHVGMGGMDIYESFGEIENFYRPENLGYPINSSKDDLYFTLNSLQNHGFLTSDRTDCEDCEGSSCYSIYEIEYGPPKFTLSGHVYSKVNKKPIPNSLITLKDVNEMFEPFFIISDENGYYFTPLRREMIYYVKAQKVRYFADATDISTKGLEKSTDLIHDFYLPKIPIGEIEIKGIFYDYDKWDLRPESKSTLDSLVFFLNVNDNITIELSSHTDDRGQDDYNEKLSQKRAQSVVDYLVLKGIPLDRLTPVGYGEKKPIINKAQTEEEHQQNRRTAFEVLREDYIPARK